MKREIKFRAWDNGTKKWLLGYEYPNLGGFSLFGECMLMGEWGHILDNYILNYEEHGHNEGDLVVMQYTGLKDKNGDEIYEGDLIKLSGMGSKYDGFVFYVGFDYGTFQLYTNDGLFPLSFVYMALQLKENNRLPESFFESIAIFMEIIGNIYENPELI